MKAAYVVDTPILLDILENDPRHPPHCWTAIRMRRSTSP